MAPNDVNQRDLRRDISYIKKKMFVTIEKNLLYVEACPRKCSSLLRSGVQ